jgi:hypothetical protein
MTVAPHMLRRYVIDRAAGRSPRQEWAYYESRLGVWIRCDKSVAERHEEQRRIRKDGLPWCPILGHCTDIRDDFDLQMHFLTVPQDDWPRMASTVRARPERCLKDWRASGTRIIAAVSIGPEAPVSGTPGPLAGWPNERGTGQRSMLPR